MAATATNTNLVLKAHSIRVNGCVELVPSLDEATLILEQAHAVLILAIEARDEGVINEDIVSAGFRAATSLLERGIRESSVGHNQLLRRMTRQ